MKQAIVAILLVGAPVGLAHAAPAADAPASDPVFKSLGKKQRKVSDRALTLPDNEKPAASATMLTTMRETFAQLLAKVKSARDEKDVLKKGCLDPKVTETKGYLRIAETADRALQEAIATGNHDAAVHEFDKVEISSTKVADLRVQSEGCVGRGDFEGTGGRSQVEVQVPNLPSSDSSTQKTSTPPSVLVPPDASGTTQSGT